MECQVSDVGSHEHEVIIFEYKLLAPKYLTPIHLPEPVSRLGQLGYHEILLWPSSVLCVPLAVARAFLDSTIWLDVFDFSLVFSGPPASFLRIDGPALMETYARLVLEQCSCG